MTNGAIHVWLTVRSSAVELRDRVRVQADGEGVISAAIAVLVMAFLGAGMWFAFNAIFSGASSDIAENVEQIGG